MSTHDFSDFWNHHTPHSLFYPAGNQPPGMYYSKQILIPKVVYNFLAQTQPTLQTLTSHAAADSAETLDPQLQQNESLGQIFNGQPNPQLEGMHGQLTRIGRQFLEHQQLGAEEEQAEQQISQQHQQQVSSVFNATRLIQIFYIQSR